MHAALHRRGNGARGGSRPTAQLIQVGGCRSQGITTLYMSSSGIQPYTTLCVGCSVVAVSDAHERSIGTDLLLGLLKKVQRVRRDLRVVIITTPPTAATFRWGPGVQRHMY